MKGKISEVFSSFQGEGIYLGEKQVFVRFFGCNLSCSYCDTKLDNFSEYEADELMEEIKKIDSEHHSISFTGGEPLLQKDFLKKALYYARCYGFKNYLETNGVLFNELEEVVDHLDIIAMDIKLPSSCGQDGFWDEHRKFLEIAKRKEVFIKLVISESTKFIDLFKAIELVKEVCPSAVVILQPDNSGLNPQLLNILFDWRDKCHESGVTACVIEQMHKRIGLN